MDIRSIVRFVSDLGGLPGVGWFVPLCPLITLWAIRSVCVSALPGSGGLGGMPVLSGSVGESDIPGITGIHGKGSNSRYSPVSGVGARCPICPICSCLLSKRTLGTYRAGNLYKGIFGHIGQRACIGVGHRRGWSRDHDRAPCLGEGSCLSLAQGHKSIVCARCRPMRSPVAMPLAA